MKGYFIRYSKRIQEKKCQVLVLAYSQQHTSYFNVNFQQLVTGHEDPTNWFEQIIYLIGTAGTQLLFAIFSMGVMRQRKDGEYYGIVTNAIYPRYDVTHHWRWRYI